MCLLKKEPFDNCVFGAPDRRSKKTKTVNIARIDRMRAYIPWEGRSIDDRRTYLLRMRHTALFLDRPSSALIPHQKRIRERECVTCACDIRARTYSHISIYIYIVCRRATHFKSTNNDNARVDIFGSANLAQTRVRNVHIAAASPRLPSSTQQKPNLVVVAAAARVHDRRRTAPQIVQKFSDCRLVAPFAFVEFGAHHSVRDDHARLVIAH